MVATPRLNQHVLTRGSGTPVCFVHGNASSAVFWEDVMTRMPDGYACIAPDLRGFGDTEDKEIDATRGFGDWADDLLALFTALGHDRVHVVAHSLGGGVVWRLIADAAWHVLSATQVAPVSPFGFGGTKDAIGTPCYADFAGSGGGVVSPEFARRISEGDRGSDGPGAPRNVMNTYYVKPPFKCPNEELLLDGLLSERIGPTKYPGDLTPSSNWPNVAPGKLGPVNAMSPAHTGDMVTRLIGQSPKPPIMWVRGSHDQVVSDFSLFDMGTLGKLGAVPGWPGEDIYPPQPMDSQTRHVLNAYAALGGQFEEHTIEDTGHSPYLEKPQAFMTLLLKQLVLNA